MKFISQLTLAALVSYASSTAVDVHKRDSPLNVKIDATGNSEVKLTLVNSGNKPLNLLSTGTLLDEKNPVEKVSMYTAGGSK